MLTKKERRAKYRTIEQLRKLRRSNLQQLAETYGSWVDLARVLGVSPSFLVQLAGPHPVRDIGEKVARDIEIRLKLPNNWLDQPSSGKWP